MTVKEILQQTTHRPWPLPAGSFAWYQEWNRLIFLHFRIDVQTIAPLLPKGLQPDLFDGSAWVSLVPFSMEHIRQRLLPAVDFISNFNEINLRTYDTDGQKAGVYFFSIEADKWLSTLMAGSISGMPYEQASLQRSYNDEHSFEV